MLAKLKLYIFGGIAIVTLLGLGYWHYTGLLEKIQAQALINQQLQISVTAQNEINSKLNDNIQDWKQSQEEYTKAVEELRSVSIKSQKEVRRLNEIFSKHDLSNLAYKKPGLIEKRITDGSNESIRMLECATGSTHQSCGTRN